MREHFEDVPFQSVNYDPVIFSKDEFDKVLNVTTEENGYDPKRKRNYYTDWLKTAFKLGAFSCLRLIE